MKKSLRTILGLAPIALSVDKEIFSPPAEPTAPNEDMGSMLINPLYELPPMHVTFTAGNRPIFIPQRKKFKGYQREQHLGRRRSKFYFNKNR